MRQTGRQIVLMAAFVAMAGAAAAAPKGGAPKAPLVRWVTSWAAAQQIAEPHNMLPAAEMSNATIRQVVRLSIGGTGYRLMLSNAFGTAPLHLNGVHIAEAHKHGAVDPASGHALTFAGQTAVTIPAGAAYLSDPVMAPVKPLQQVAISIYYGAAPEVQTAHPGSRATSYILPGDHLNDAAMKDAKTVDHWYQIAAIEVLAPLKAAAVTVLGDSITDGRGSTTNANDRWTDILAEKLQTGPGPRPVAVLNKGLGGNCMLKQCLGPNALSRIERDVLSPPGVTTLIVLEGVNDLGSLTIDNPATPEQHAELVAGLIAGYKMIAARARAHGLKAYIGTILPYGGSQYYHPDAANEADRNAVNDWIRRQSVFHGVIDFDAALRDPADPSRLNPAYDCGDFLHPSAAGYRVMGELAAKVLMAGPKKKSTPKRKTR